MVVAGDDFARPRLSRRDLLRAGALGGAALVLSPRLAGRALAQPPLDFPPGLPLQKLLNPRILKQWLDPLPVPPELAASALHGSTLTMAATGHRFHSTLPAVPSWGYGGATHLGPTIRAQRGVPVQFTAVNNLSTNPVQVDTTLHGPDAWVNPDGTARDLTEPRTSLHKHGGYTEQYSDGYPEYVFTKTGFGPAIHGYGTGSAPPVPPNWNGNNTWTYRYSNDQQAGPIWYHDHALGITRLNVYSGLAGVYLLEDPNAPVGGLPSTYGVDDFPLVLQDKAFDRTTSALYYAAAWVPEFFGNVPVINGAILPHLKVGTGVYRLRLLNGSPSRFYHLRLSDSTVPMWQIATDSGYVSSPRAMRSLVLAPGERAEVVIDFTNAALGAMFLQDVNLPKGTVSPSPGSFGNILQFQVGAVPANTPGPFIPGAVTGLPGFVPLPATTDAAPPTPLPSNVRIVTLVEVMNPATGMPAASLLNNLKWPMANMVTDFPEERPTANSLEEWWIVNLTADSHPIHLHLVQFQLRDRVPFNDPAYITRVYGGPLMTDATGAFTGQSGHGPLAGVSLDPRADFLGAPLPPAPFEVGWKDTVMAHPGMVTRIKVPFGNGAAAGVPFGASQTYKGRYAWHCHILDHEDNEMMLPYSIV